WWPGLRARHPLLAPAGGARTPADQALVEHLHQPPGSEPGLVGQFPAHLHIDLLPEAQGRGLGRALIEAFVTTLRDAEVTGVHLGVDRRNHGALSFYQRLGFTRWPGSGDAGVLVRDLARESRAN
ncbi:MAG: GNAT family N-acetyltransferase, partial [Candidatus Nanopelagicales bacterium]